SPPIPPQSPHTPAAAPPTPHGPDKPEPPRAPRSHTEPPCRSIPARESAETQTTSSGCASRPPAAPRKPAHKMQPAHPRTDQDETGPPSPLQRAPYFSLLGGTRFFNRRYIASVAYCSLSCETVPHISPARDRVFCPSVN